MFQFNPFTGNFDLVGSGGTPGGSHYNVQLNNGAGGFAGSSAFTSDANGIVYINDVNTDLIIRSTSNNANTIVGGSTGDAPFPGGASFFGYAAGAGATNANYSTFVGLSAGQSALNASYATALGYGAGVNAQTGSWILIGILAGQDAYSAGGLIGLGYQAAYQATNAQSGLFIGNYAGFQDSVNNVSTNSTSISIGQFAGTGGYPNSISLGRGVINSAALQFNVGNVLFINGIYNSDTQDGTAISTALVGIGNNSPTDTLTIGNTSADYKITSPGQLWLIGNTSGGSSYYNLVLGVDPTSSGNGGISFQTGVNPNALLIDNSGKSVFGGNAGFGGVTTPAYGIDNYGTANFNTTTGGVPNIQLMGNGTPMGYISAISEAGSVGTNPSDAQVGDIVIQNLGAGAARILFAAYNGGGAKSSGFFDLDDNFNLQNEAGGIAKFDTAALAAARTFSFPDTQNQQAIFNITVANATIKGKTAAQTVVSLNAATTGEYVVGCGLLINAVTLKTIKMQVQYNDQNNTLQTIDLFPQGLTNAVISTAGVYLYGSVSVSCTSGSNINVLVTQVVAGTSINYDAWATVVQAH